MVIDFSSFKEQDQNYEFTGRTLFRIIYDQTTRQFRCLTRNIRLLDDLQKAFKAENPSAFFMKQYGYDVDPDVFFVNSLGLFPLGLIFDVIKFITTSYGNIEVLSMSECAKRVIMTCLRPLNPASRNIGEDWVPDNIADDSGANDIIFEKSSTPGFKYRPYQMEAVKKLILAARGRGMIEIPTAGGKSLIIANFVYNVVKYFEPDSQTLVLVPNKQLVVQMYRDFVSYGWKKADLTIMSGGKITLDGYKLEKYNKDAKVIFANRQYVMKNVQLLPKIGILFVDECHSAVAEATSNFINNLPCSVKVGCSGTIPKQGADKYKLTGMLGNVVYRENITMLQEAGYISRVVIDEIDITDENVHPDMLFHLRPRRKYNPIDYNGIDFDEAYKDEVEYMNANFSREYSPVLEIMEKKMKGNTLVLFDLLELGKGMFELAKEHGLGGKDIFYIDGSTDVSERERIRDLFEESGNNVLFAQAAVMSTGTNIKRLNNLVILFRSKSTVRVIQSIGRILRLHEDKVVARVYDIRFNMKYSQKHFKERVDLYKRFYGIKPIASYNITIPREEKKESEKQETPL